MTWVRRSSSFLACLLALLVALGAAAPASALVWQCRHASRLVAALLPASAGAMPGMSRSHLMACCLPPSSVRAALVPGHKPRLAAPACHPTLACVALVSAATLPLRPKLLSLAGLPCATPPRSLPLGIAFPAPPARLRPPRQALLSPPRPCRRCPACPCQCLRACLERLEDGPSAPSLGN